MSLQCCACQETLSLSAFSNNQRRKEAPRCLACIAAAHHTVLVCPESSSRCCTCKAWLPHGARADPQNSRCSPCAVKANERESAAQNEAARRTHGCQVKHVKKRFGHLCEISLQAYVDADVASSRNDYVTELDVENASDAWDARSIAHDIDTQWGDMPQGGAYKDSNIYWGPGIYDFC